MNLTDYHAKYFAHELTKRSPSDSVEMLAGVLADAQVDLNPHQIEAALFAFRNPFSRGAILADEVGLGKTIEAGLLLAQRWAERKRKLLVILPANLRKRTREPDRLRIRPYRLRRQLRVDIATVFFIDEDGRQLRRWDGKTRLALFRGIQEGLAETLVGEVDRLLTVLRFIGIEPDYRRNAIADLLKSARAHPASIGMYHQANIVEILPFDNVDDVGDMGVEIYVLVQQMRTLAEPCQGR